MQELASPEDVSSPWSAECENPASIIINGVIGPDPYGPDGDAGFHGRTVSKSSDRYRIGCLFTVCGKTIRCHPAAE